jgi:hypothetical protein
MHVAGTLLKSLLYSFAVVVQLIDGNHGEQRRRAFSPPLSSPSSWLEAVIA